LGERFAQREAEGGSEQRGAAEAEGFDARGSRVETALALGF
jgi:hypothetical protein